MTCVVRRKAIVVYYEIITRSLEFQVTDLLNGMMDLSQNGTARDTDYVSSQQPVNHTIALKAADSKLIAKSAYQRVYWFIDCVYVGQTDNLTFTNLYNKERAKYEIEALLVLSYEPVRLQLHLIYDSV